MLGRRGALQGQGQKQRRPGGENVTAGHQLVVAVFFPILEVIEDLKSDAHVLAEFADQLFITVGGTGQANSGVQGRLEGRSRLQGVDLQGVQGGQGLLAGLAPEQLGTLALGELEVGVRQSGQDVGHAVAAEILLPTGDQAIAQADQVIADIDGRAHAVLAVEGRSAIAEGVIVLDVIMDQRRLVKNLDGQGDAA